MRSLSRLILLISCTLFLGTVGAVPVSAEEGRLGIELNKLEETDAGACRAMFLFRNGTTFSLSGFEMSLAVINSDGIIDRLLTLDAAPLPKARTTLKLFEIPERSCDGMSEMIMHDITTCTPQNGTEIDCYDVIELGSRSAVALTK